MVVKIFMQTEQIISRPGFFARTKASIILFFAVLGPGLITAVADNDAGGVATYTVAAATFGMASQYLIVITTLLLAVTQEIGARITIVTGKGLADLIREYYGAKVAVIVFFVYFWVNQGVVVQNVSGLKSAIQLLGAPWQPVLVLSCLMLSLLVIFLDFKKLQRIFLLTILFYVCYLISAILAKPDWGEALHNSLIYPTGIDISNPKYWFTLIAVLGTTITAWGQFFVGSFVADKGLKVSELKEERAEIYIGAILTNVFSWLIAVAVTYTLFKNGIAAVDGASAALAIEPLVGHLSSVLFSVGLLAASFLGLAIVPLATAYVFTEFFGFERTLNASFSKGRTFYTIFLLQIGLALLVALFPKINLFNLTLYADYLNGAMLPVIFYFLVRFSEDKRLMGDHASRGFRSWFLRLCALFITLAVLVTFVAKLRGA